LTDPKFRLQTKDKYGRRNKTTMNEAESELKEFYTVEGKSNDQIELANEDCENDYHHDDDDNDDREDQGDNEADVDQDPASRIAYLTALSRGELDVSESSDDDSDEESEEEVDSEFEEPILGKAGILDPSTKEEDEVSLTNVPSPYMAVMHMDWAHVRAVDLFAMLASFTAPGSIRKVQIFPSDYGLERMEKEKVHGPINIWKKSKKMKDGLDDEGSEDDDNSEEDTKGAPTIKFELDDEAADPSFDPEKLRVYEASKLKYHSLW
jgi:hypothetical protein